MHNINTTTIDILSKSLTIGIADCLKNAPTNKMKDFVATHLYDFIDRIEEKFDMNSDETMALLSMLSINVNTTVNQQTVHFYAQWRNSDCAIVFFCECMSTDDYDFSLVINREVGTNARGISITDF